MLLVVEDNAEDARLIMETLGRQLDASRMQHAQNATEAIDYITRREHHSLQLVILDAALQAPPFDDVLRQLRALESTRRVPVVVFTDGADPEQIGLSYDLGANSVLYKPAMPAEFTEVLAALAPYWLALNQTDHQSRGTH